MKSPATQPILDRLIAGISPAWALSRMKSRLCLQLAQRGYEAASQAKRLQSWKSSVSDANRELVGDLPLLRARHRQLRRDNPYVSRAISGIATNMIGAGILASSPDERFVADWQAWADSTDCDADGRHNLYGLMRVVAEAVAESGEVLIRRRIRRSEDGKRIPLQLQILEADYLDHQKTDDVRDGYIIQGVEFDPIGRRRAYWLYQIHPGAQTGYRTRMLSAPVPASEILHVYRMDRPGQMRGVPWGTPCMVRVHALDKFEDAQLERVAIANLVTAFLTDEHGDASTFGEGATAPVDLSLEPGAVIEAPPGKSITFSNPPDPGNPVPFINFHLHAIATGYQVPYELLTGDMSQVNFSSARMRWNDFERDLESWRWHMMIPQFCEPVWRWFANARESVTKMPMIDPPPVEWTPPARIMVDARHEVPALIAKIRAGLMSQPEGIRQMGYYHEKTVQEIKAWNEMIDAAGLILDSDPRRVNGSGAYQVTVTENENNSAISPG